MSRRGGAAWVKGFGGVRRGFEADARGLEVFQKGLGPFVEEVVRRLIKPPASVPIPIGLKAEGVALGALVQEVVERVGRPAAPASELVRGDVRPEPSGIIRCERMAHGQAEGRGGGVSGVHGEGLARFWVRERAHSLLPERVVVAVGGFGDGVLVHKGGVRTGAGRDGPFGSPPGKGAFPGNGLAVRGRLYPVEGGARGDAASREGFEAGR